MSTKSSFAFIFFLFFLNNSYSQRNLKEENELSDDIIILHTNDVHCGIMDTIGYDGLNLYKKELKTKYKHVLLVDAGDHIQGGAIGLLSKGKDIIDIMNYLEYDVVVIGNHEFDYKVEQLFNLSEIINATYICSNFLNRTTNQTIFKPYKIVEVGNVSIGFIGVITPQTLTKTYLHTLVDENGTLLYDFLNDKTGQKLYDRVQSYIDELRNEKNVTYVIIVAHMGYGGDSLPEYNSYSLLANISGVDAIIDGHSHKIYNSSFPDKFRNYTHISQTGTKLEMVGKITITSEGNITSELVNNITLFEGYDGPYHLENRGGEMRYVDNDTNIFLNSIMAEHSDEFNEIIGNSSFDLPICTREKGRIIRFEENTLGNLVTDIYRYYGQSDISITDAGTVRDGLYSGNITFEKIINVLPFSDNLYVKNISGLDILDALEFGVSNLPQDSSKFNQVSGIRFKIDETIKSSVVLDDQENFVKVEGERRVYDVYVGDEKLDENKNYTITFNSFLSDGGDGYSMFKKYELLKDTSLLDHGAFKMYLENVLNRTIPDIYKVPQGRIVKQKKYKNEANYFNKYFKGFSLLLLSLML